METFFLLIIVNHKTRQFNLRVEDDRGDPGTGSIHAFASYTSVMARQLERYRCGKVKHHWMFPFWEAVIGDVDNCEQHVMAVVDAADLRSARALMKPHRESAKQFYRALGYNSFYTQNEDLSIDPDESSPEEDAAEQRIQESVGQRIARSR